MSKKSVSPNKSNQIYRTVRDDIIHGIYPGGTFITEAALCEQFTVSRTPIREALIRLAQDRFVELIPNKGAIVPYVTINDIVEVYQLRMVNDGLAAALVPTPCSKSWRPPSSGRKPSLKPVKNRCPSPKKILCSTT